MSSRRIAPKRSTHLLPYNHDLINFYAAMPFNNNVELAANTKVTARYYGMASGKCADARNPRHPVLALLTHGQFTFGVAKVSWIPFGFNVDLCLYCGVAM
jgi:hypothetical protein